jgi:hypothetical protein
MVFVLGALALGPLSACGVAPRPHVAAATPSPHISTPAVHIPASYPRAWDLFLSGPVVGRVHASVAHACGAGPLPTGGFALHLNSYFELAGGEYDVDIWVTADRLAPGTYPARIRMSVVDSGDGSSPYVGTGMVRIVETDAQYAGSITGSLAPDPTVPGPPALGALQLDGQWQCPRLPSAPTRAP